MPPRLPPAAQKGGKSQTAAINALLKRFPGYRQYMPTINAAAARWGMDPVLLLATLAWENQGAKAGARNSMGARGLGQIVDTTVGHYNKPQYASFIAQFAPDGRITDKRAYDPVFSINYMAWRMVGHIRQYGSLNAGYSKGYNPGFTGDKRGKGPAAFVPAWYWAQSKIAPSPGDVVGKRVDTKVAAADNPWLQGQNFLDYWQQRINPIYEAYTGHPLTSRAEARNIIAKGWSDYHLQLVLSTKKSFIGSPIWKAQAPGYMATYRDIYGDRKPDQKLISYAIIHNLGATGFAEQLRQGKGYLQSNEFAGNVATLQNVYSSLFGHPDVNALYVIKQATLHNWSPDQFAKYLRAQPEYTQSSEFRDNASKLAAVFGGTPTLTKEQALGSPAPTSGVPTDPRLGPPPWEPTPAPTGTKPKGKGAPKKAAPQTPKPQPVAGGAGGQQQ